MLSHPLILASQSPRREQILKMLGFDFEIVPPHADETPPPGLEAEAIPEALARVKALAVSGLRPEALVLGSDTLVEIDGRILGKPANAAEAVSMLQWLNGRAHRVFTGVALARAGTLLASATERTEVTFALRPVSELEAYVQGGEPMDKAGSYAIQGRGAFLVEKNRRLFFQCDGTPGSKNVKPSCAP